MSSNTSRDDNNWVDRGEPDFPQLVVVLRHFFGPERGIAEERFEDAARDIQGLVGGFATELHVSGYLRRLGEELGIDENELPPRRMAATALWSIAKLAIVRDTALRALEGRLPKTPDQPASLSDWIASRLLTPEEFEAWRVERAAAERPLDDDDPRMR
jgi:hypothetical protein